MSDKSRISWTNTTWNPIRGCSRVSAGCMACYAERMAGRFSGAGQPYEGLITLTAKGPRWAGDVRFVAEHLADPLKWRKPRRIFVNSMSDLFHERLTNEQIAAVFGVMSASPRHTFQVLTKRAARMRAWFEWIASTGDPTRAMVEALTTFGDGEERKAKADVVSRIMLGPTRADWRPVPESERGLPAWPLPNVWIGVSVENQAAADERIPELLRTPAAVRWISAEPLLGPVDLRPWTSREHGLALIGAPRGLAWIVAGCESGHGARPAEVDWFRSLRDQCAAAGVAFFLKQAIATPGVGVLAPSSAPPEIITAVSPTERARFTDALIAGPGSHRKAGGLIGLPYLDGVQHAEMPEVAP